MIDLKFETNDELLKPETYTKELLNKDEFLTKKMKTFSDINFTEKVAEINEEFNLKNLELNEFFDEVEKLYKK